MKQFRLPILMAFLVSHSYQTIVPTIADDIVVNCTTSFNWSSLIFVIPLTSVSENSWNVCRLFSTFYCLETFATTGHRYQLKLRLWFWLLSLYHFLLLLKFLYTGSRKKL